MFGPSAYGQPKAKRPPSLDPMAHEFAPTSKKVCNPLWDATFVTKNIPDIPPNANIVGICTVPQALAGMDKLGYHIADFLAFKYLLHNEKHRSQDWLAHCDVVDIVKSNPDLYVHGKDRRVVLEAEGNGGQETSYSHTTDIKIQTDPQKLMCDFVIACSVKAHLSEESGAPVCIVVCGPTTLEQDIFIGEANAAHHLKSDSIRHTIGGDLEVIMVTPALFSAGWQVNPSFLRPSVQLRADRMTFVARQFGGIFAKSHIGHFVGSDCPFFKGDGMEKKEANEKFSDPFITDEQKEILASLKISIHSSLASRLSVGHGDHSFDFEADNDDWENLIGPRKYLSLDDYRKKWEKLRVSSRTVKNERFGFLGDAFGGSQKSQLSHVKQLIKESFESWPNYWELPASNEVKSTFQKLLDNQIVDEDTCHEIFNVLEHRATLAVLGDITIRSLDIPKPAESRCRDWNERVDFTSVSVPYRQIIGCIPGVAVPPQVNPNGFSAIQKYFDQPVFYLALAIARHRKSLGGDIDSIARRARDFFESVKSRQIDLLCTIPEVEQKCVAWLKAIDMPIRRQGGDPTTLDKLVIRKEAADSSPLTVVYNPRHMPSTQLRDTLEGVMLGGQATFEVSVMDKSQAEVEEYFVQNPFARMTLNDMLSRGFDAAMTFLLDGYGRLYRSMHNGSDRESWVAIQRDFDHVSRKIIFEYDKSREGVDAQPSPSVRQAAAPQPATTPQPPSTAQMPQTIGHQGSSPATHQWVPPHLRHKTGVAKENDPSMGSPQGSSSSTAPHRAQSAVNQPSPLAPRKPEGREKKPMRLDTETLMRRHNRRSGGGGAPGGAQGDLSHLF